MAAAPAAKGKKKQDNPAALVAVLAVILVVVGFVNKDKIFGKGKAPVKAGAAVGGGPGGGPDSGSSGGLTPQDIPALSPEIIKKITDKTKGTQFPRNQVEGGANPFLPRTITQEEIDNNGSMDEPAAKGPSEEVAPVFAKKIYYWGAFLLSDVKKAVIQIEGEPNTFMFVPGEEIPTTPFTFTRFLKKDLAIELIEPAKGRKKERRIEIAFAGDEHGGMRVRGGGGLNNQDEYQGLFKNDQGGAPGGGTPVPRLPPGAMPKGQGNLEKAFDH